MAVLNKNSKGYGYTYTDLAEINKYIESLGETYYQYVETDANGNDYIVTVRQNNGTEKEIRGSRIIPAALSGKSNPVQEYGAGLTYIRRYSLLMAYGLATEDNDAANFSNVSPLKKDLAETRAKHTDMGDVSTKTKSGKPTVTVPQDNTPMSDNHKELLQILLSEAHLMAVEVFGKPLDEMYDRDFERAQSAILKKAKEKK